LHKDLEKQVTEGDRLYFEELFPDLLERAKVSPEEVFRQLSSLSAGPLLADESVWIDASEDQLAEMYPSLKRLM
jgi:hypothetical protein